MFDFDDPNHRFLIVVMGRESINQIKAFVVSLKIKAEVYVNVAK